MLECRSMCRAMLPTAGHFSSKQSNTKLSQILFSFTSAEYIIRCRRHPWYSGSALYCWPTGQAIDPEPGAWFIAKFISFAQVVSGPGMALIVQNRGLKRRSFIHYHQMPSVAIPCKLENNASLSSTFSPVCHGALCGLLSSTDHGAGLTGDGQGWPGHYEFPPVWPFLLAYKVRQMQVKR